MYLIQKALLLFIQLLEEETRVEKGDNSFMIKNHNKAPYDRSAQDVREKPRNMYAKACAIAALALAGYGGP